MTTIETVLAKQNRDGGWPYAAGASWTEPTVLAILAALNEGRAEAAARGAYWLRKLQREDGGFPPQAAVQESTWVTSLAALLPPELLGAPEHDRAIQWIFRLTGQETSPIYRIRQWLLGNTGAAQQNVHGWPWFPGTAAWVGPTAFGILALRRENMRRPQPALVERIGLGRRFLLNRMCREGGWNHGASNALGYDAQAYPETTGMALLALRDVQAPQVPKALRVAERFLRECRSADGQNWLRLGLLAHEDLPAGYCPPPLPVRTLRDATVSLLADQAAAGKNAFL